jgi:hypothetical protein
MTASNLRKGHITQQEQKARIRYMICITHDPMFKSHNTYQEQLHISMSIIRVRGGAGQQGNRAKKQAAVESRKASRIKKQLSQVPGDKQNDTQVPEHHTSYTSMLERGKILKRNQKGLKSGYASRHAMRVTELLGATKNTANMY